MPRLRFLLLLAAAFAPAESFATDLPDEEDPALPAKAVRLGTSAYRLGGGWHHKTFFTPDGKGVIVAREGAAVEVWNPDTGRRLSTFNVPKARFEDTDYFPAADLMVAIGSKYPDDENARSVPTVWLIEAATGKVVRATSIAGVPWHSSGGKIRFTPDGKRLVMTADPGLRVWDVKTGEEVIRQASKGGTDALAVSPDGKTVAFGRYELSLWDWESGEEPRKFATINGAGVEMALFTPDGKTLLAAGLAERPRAFDMATGREAAPPDMGGRPWKWSLSPDGRTLAVACYNRSGDRENSAVALWDVATGKVRGNLRLGHEDAACACWSPDGSRVAAATDHQLWVWDAKTFARIGPDEPGHAGMIAGFAFGPDGTAFSASDDHTIRSWDADTGKPGLTLMHKHWVRAVDVSPDGALVAGSVLRNELRVWDAKTGAERFKLLGNGEMGGHRRLRFTPDGTKLIAWGDDLYVRTWDTRTGKLLAEHRPLPDGVTEETLTDDRRDVLFLGLGASDISADGTKLAICPHRKVKIWDTATGQELAAFEADPNGVLSVAFSPDGKRLATTGRGKKIEVRMPDGGTRHTSDNTHQTVLWDIATAKVVWRMTAPGDELHGEIRFTPDGRLAERVTTPEKGPRYISFRDGATGTELGRVPLPARSFHFAFDRTGKKMAVGQANTTAILYDLETVYKPGPAKEDD